MRLLVVAAAISGAGLVIGCSAQPESLGALTDNAGDSSSTTAKKSSSSSSSGSSKSSDDDDDSSSLGDDDDDSTTTTKKGSGNTASSPSAGACTPIAAGSYTLATPTWSSGSDTCTGTSAVPYMASPITIAQASDGSFTMTDSVGWVTALKLDSTTCALSGTQSQTEKGGFVFATTLQLAPSSGGIKATDATAASGGSSCTATATVVGTAQ